MQSLHQRIEQLEAENSLLHMLADHFPNGALFRIQLKASILSSPDASEIWLNHLQLVYASANWEKISNIPLNDAMQDTSLLFMRIYPKDLERLIPVMYDCLHDLSTLNVEIRFIQPDETMRWLQISAHLHSESEWIVINGFILDVSNRKHIENELSMYREELRNMVKDRTENLEAVNEAYIAVNEELEATNEQLIAINNELNLYKNQLEKMVDLKTRQQDILIKVLQVLQSSDGIPEALNIVLAEIGIYTGVSRVYILENDHVNRTLSNTYEWCNRDIESMMKFSQQIPLGKCYNNVEQCSYLHLFSSIVTEAAIAEAMELRGILSVLAIPLVVNNAHYGFVVLDECRFDRRWEKEEINLYISISQIISNTIRRYQAEKAMHLSQQTMRTIFDNIDAGIFVSDFDTYKILFANKKIKDRTGNIEGRRCWEVLQKDMTGPCSFCPKVYLRDQNNHPTGSYYWEHRNTNNQNWYTCSDAAIEWVDGRWVHLEHAMNISQRKKVEIELIQAKEKAEESEKLKSAFLANLSHEIRTPLNCINGFINFMDDDELTTSRRRNYINIINNSAIQLSKLIDDIVDVAIIESGQMNLLPVAFHVNDFLEKIYNDFYIKLYYSGKSHAALVLDSDGFIDQCICFIDSSRLRQILVNLLNNAFKYLDKGYIRFGYRKKEAGLLEFVVDDSGVGIPESQQKVIFELFRQGEQNVGRRYGGTGLGLTISHKLIKMMGGDIHVESTEGFGSTFRFTVAYLPVAHADVPFFDLLPENPITPVDLFAGKTVLVVEPVDLIFLYYEKILSASGLNVVRIASQTKLTNTKAHAIVIPLTGTENTMSDTAQQFKIPIIYIINGQMDEYRHLTHNNPNSILLTGPVNYEELTSTLKRVLKD